MTYEGIDTVARITAAQARKMRENGIAFAGRYIGPESWGKTITRSETELLLGEGVAILLCWETVAERMRGGASAGAEDGASALRWAISLGVPAGTVIYFACDYYPPYGELALCDKYTRAAQAALGSTYEAGVYGPQHVVSYLSESGACDKFWQCVGGSNMFLPVAKVRQYAGQDDVRAKDMAKKLGIMAVDLDASEDLRGLWRPKETETHWYDDTVLWAEKEGICDGTRPEDPATRAEVAQMFRNYNRRFESEDYKSTSGLLAD